MHGLPKMMAGAALTAVVGLAGCGSSTQRVSVPSGSGGPTVVTVPVVSGGSSNLCSSLVSASQKLDSGLLAELTVGAGSVPMRGNTSTASTSAELASEIPAFKDLAASAPSAIKVTLDDLVARFTAADQASSSLTKDATELGAPTGAEQKLTSATSGLSADDIKLGTSIARHCG